jgi:hypothetical protein
MKRWALTAATVGFALPAHALSVVSDTDCPSAPDVQSALSDLVPAVDTPAVEVRVRSTVETLLVEFASEGEPLRSRELRAEGDCAARARTAALVAAAWLDALPAQSLDAPEAPGVPTPQPATAPEPPQAAAPEPATTTPRLWLGFGAFGLIDDWGASTGVLGDGQFGGLTGPVDVGLSLAVPLARRADLGKGTALWWRPSAELTLRVPLAHGEWIVSPGLGAVVALLRVSGSGYDHDNTDTVTTWGARAQLRVQRPWMNHGLWIEVGARIWPLEQHLRNNVNGGDPVLRGLPRWDGQVAVGFSFATL